MKACAILLAISTLGACGVIAESSDHIVIEPFRELVIVDEAVVNNYRSANATKAPWSFHHLLTEATREPSLTDVRQHPWFATSDEIDQRVIEQHVICPWLKARGENACDSSCFRCRARTLDLALAPVRLIAIVYRPDLAFEPGGLSEARMVFAVTEGSADDPSHTELPFTIAFEYALSGERTSAQWAKVWHALGKAQSPSEMLFQLELLIRDFADRHNTPPNLARVRVSNGLRASHTMQEWVLSADRHAWRSNPLANTPHLDVPRDELVDFLQHHRADVIRQVHKLPQPWLAMHASLQAETLTLPLDAALNNAFHQGTCTGCHLQDAGHAAESLKGFHIAPQFSGRDRLSRFLWDEQRPEKDEIARRSAALRTLVAQ